VQQLRSDLSTGFPVRIIFMRLGWFRALQAAKTMQKWGLVNWHMACSFHRELGRAIRHAPETKERFYETH